MSEKNLASPLQEQFCTRRKSVFLDADKRSDRARSCSQAGVKPALEGPASHQVARPLEGGRQLPTLSVGRQGCRPESERVKGLSLEMANMGRTTLSFMAEVKMDTLKRKA